MPFSVYATVAVPTYTTDRAGNPKHMYPLQKVQRVFVASYGTKLLAQWWGLNLKRVYLDAAKTQIVTERQILSYEIVEEP